MAPVAGIIDKAVTVPCHQANRISTLTLAFTDKTFPLPKHKDAPSLARSVRVFAT
jgi:hypothetical protein